MFGIVPKSYELILKALSEFDEIEKAAIYGSRAMGNFKQGSDIDLAIFGNKITPETLLKLKTKLEQELPIPYYFDLTHYETISNSELKKHIDEFGKVFYSE
jgi:predicted nucleotidyltransferase